MQDLVNLLKDMISKAATKYNEDPQKHLDVAHGIGVLGNLLVSLYIQLDKKKE